MDIPQRRAVSPIIATLLLIAIAVAAGIIVYIFVGGLSSSLTKSGGSQVTAQISMDAYNFPGTTTAVASNTAPGFLTLYLRNTGSGTVTISEVFYDGVPITVAAPPPGTGALSVQYWSSTSATLAPGATAQLGFSSTSLGSSTTPPLPSAGTTHLIKIVASDGSTFSFSPVAGSSG